MAVRKKAAKKRGSRSGEATFRFKIDAFSPATIPMARLAEYMGALAQMLGEPTAVHFDRLEAGSTSLLHKVERDAVPVVVERAKSLRRGDASPETMDSYRNINRMLREDNGRGFYGREGKEGKSAEILTFPGRDEVVRRPIVIRQRGSLDGWLMRIGGTDATIHLLLQSEDRRVSGCWTTKALGKKIAKHLFEPLRVHGTGKWIRDTDGNWDVEDFKVEAFEELSDIPLSQALLSLREVPGDWGDDAIEELELMRKGTPETRNGAD
jgi:hypothetical protein